MESKSGYAFYAILIILKGYVGDLRGFWLLGFYSFKEFLDLAIISLHKDLHGLLSIRSKIARRETFQSNIIRIVEQEIAISYIVDLRTMNHDFEFHPRVRSAL